MATADSDLIAGADAAGMGAEREGLAYVFYGSPHGLAGVGWWTQGTQYASYLGRGWPRPETLTVTALTMLSWAPLAFGTGNAIKGGSVCFTVPLPVWRLARHGTPWAAVRGATSGTLRARGAMSMATGLRMCLWERGFPPVPRRGGRACVFAGSPAGLPGAAGGGEKELPRAWRVLPPPPPWWRTGWFLAASTTVLAGGGLWSARRLELGRFRRQVRELEQQRTIDQERARIAEDMHDQLGASLTSIALLSGLVQQRLEAPDATPGGPQRMPAGLAMLPARSPPPWTRLYGRWTRGATSTFAETFLEPTGVRYRLDLPKTSHRFPCRPKRAIHSSS